MKDKTKKWLAVAGLLAVCAVLVFGISRVLYHEPDREAQVVERESEETELFVETETPEPAPYHSCLLFLSAFLYHGQRLCFLHCLLLFQNAAYRWHKGKVSGVR